MGVKPEKNAKLPESMIYAFASPMWVHKHYIQDAQLSQRDRAAGCVIVFAKSRRLERGDNILRTVQVYLQPL